MSSFVRRAVRRGAVLGATLALAATVAAAAQEAAPGPRLGPETNMPLPRFVTLNTESANARRGPGLSHRIDWVFVRRGQPLEVIAEHGHWRRVVDADGAGGWVHHTLLRGGRAAIVVAQPEATLHAEPHGAARPVARVQTGVIGELEECLPDWCRLAVEGAEGWARKADLWGARPDETFD